MRTLPAPGAGRKKDEDEQAIEELSAANRYLHNCLSAVGAGTTSVDTGAWASVLNRALSAYHTARCEVARLRRINAELEEELDPVRIVA